MKQTTRTALAGLLSAFGAALNALAAEISAGEESTPEAAAPPKTRARKSVAAQETVAGNPEPSTSAPPASKGETAQTSNGAAEESPEENTKRYEANRALIEPIVKSGNGPAVKNVISKYSTNGLKELPIANQAAFEKDLESLSY